MVRIARSGWVPAGLVATGTALLLAWYGVPLGTTALFAVYLVVGVVVPGTLLWRRCHGRGPFIVDVAAGTALGYAVEVLAYLPARAAGVPHLALLWPVAAIGAFSLVRNLKNCWRSDPDAGRPPARWSWSMAAVVAVLVLWSVKFFRVHGLSAPGYRTPDTDSPFHLALLGEAKHHLPLATPWLSGEPLYYHWFVYAEMAATSWATGIEPQVLLLRLAPLPMLVAFTVLVAVLARTLFGPWWTGVAAAGGTLFVLAPDPYGWPRTWFEDYFAFSPFEDGSSLRTQLWTSPTQTFGALLFAGLVLALVGVLRSGGGARWAVFAVLLGAVSGAKATFLPLLLAGVLAVAVLGRPHRRRALVALGMTAVALLFAQLVLFGGTSQGLGWEPLATMRIANVAVPTGFVDDPRPWRLVLVCALTVGGWLCVWSGMAGLRSLPPEMVLLLGIGAAALGAVLLLGQSGGSQGYFLQSARPYLTLAAVGGLLTLLRTHRPGWRHALAVLAGLLIVEVVRLVGPSTMPTGNPRHVATDLALPYLALAVTAAVLSLALRRPALVVCLLAGLGMSTAVHHVGDMVGESAAHGWRDVPSADPVLTAGTLEAGRWLRDHSRPDDLVATNAHCLTVTAEGCTNLHFSVAAYTERRLLVEGWGFTTTAHVRAAELHTWVGSVPYWHPDVLAANDAAFTTPSAQTVSRLRDRFGVRWLFADETQPGYSARLADFATPRYHSGACTVFELAGTP